MTPIVFPDTKIPSSGPFYDLAKESATRRRTRIAAELIESGTHPLTRLPLLIGPSLTCGNCEHSMISHRTSRNYWKCAKVRSTFGPATDLKLKWPACSEYESEAKL